MLESKIQSNYIKKLEADGYYVVKLMSTNKNGIPDLLAIKDGVASFYEIKQAGKKPAPLQAFRMKELRIFGCKTYVWDSVSLLEL
jgi:Holliday junction resolvase